MANQTRSCVAGARLQSEEESASVFAYYHENGLHTRWDHERGRGAEGSEGARRQNTTRYCIKLTRRGLKNAKKGDIPAIRVCSMRVMCCGSIPER